MESRVWGLTWGLGFRVCGVGFGSSGSGGCSAGFSVEGLGLVALGLGGRGVGVAEEGGGEGERMLREEGRRGGGDGVLGRRIWGLGFWF